MNNNGKEIKPQGLRRDPDDSMLLTMTLPEIPDGENRYRIGGNYFSLPGAWKVEVAVRCKGLEDAAAQIPWNIAPSDTSRPVVLSNQPWGTPMTMAAAGLFIFVLIVALGTWMAQKRPLS